MDFDRLYLQSCRYLSLHHRIRMRIRSVYVCCKYLDVKKIGIGILLLLMGLLYYMFNPVSNSFFPKCPFLLLTELKCPGCGSQRAIHSLLHFDIVAAFKFNALLVLSLPIIALLIYAEFNRVKKPRLYSSLHNSFFIWIYFAIIIAWWIGRNIFDF